MPRMEKTQDQILVSSSIDGVLSKSDPWNWRKKVRAMRHDPTIGFLRDMFLAPLLASDWSVQADHPEFKSAEEDIFQNFVPLRFEYMRHAMRGLYDFGWQPFETVWEYRNATGLMALRKMKPLLQDITDILVDAYGDIRGVRNRPIYLANIMPDRTAGGWIDLNRDESFVIYRDVEGTDWYGDPIMRRAETPFDSWNECEKAAKRFDTKIAGAHWVVYYPIGTSNYGGLPDVDNYIIARDILNSMEASGKIAVPMKLLQQMDGLNLQNLGQDKMAWKIELISVSGTSESSFVGRQRYLDGLKCRALGFPERAVTEGQYGTKAEAEAHADFAIDNMQMFLTETVDQLNKWPVKFLLEMNHGPQFVGHVKIVTSPLTDVRRAQLRALYMQYFNSPQGQAEEAEAVDFDTVRDELGIPTRAEQRPMSDAADAAGVGTDSPAGGAGPAASAVDPNAAAATSLGEYTDIGQRAFANNVKRIRSVLEDVANGGSRVFAEQLLASIGLPTARAKALLDDAQSGDGLTEQL